MLKAINSFSSFSTDDIENAKAFYENTLEVEVKTNEMGILELLLENNPVIIYPKGKDHAPASHTVLNFVVEDIEEAVDNLIQKGVTFEQYEKRVLTDRKGICRNAQGPAIAWFKDSAGNILSLMQDSPDTSEKNHGNIPEAGRT